MHKIILAILALTISSVVHAAPFSCEQQLPVIIASPVLTSYQKGFLEKFAQSEDLVSAEKICNCHDFICRIAYSYDLRWERGYFYEQGVLVKFQSADGSLQILSAEDYAKKAYPEEER